MAQHGIPVRFSVGASTRTPNRYQLFASSLVRLAGPQPRIGVQATQTRRTSKLLRRLTQPSHPTRPCPDHDDQGKLHKRRSGYTALCVVQQWKEHGENVGNTSKHSITKYHVPRRPVGRVIRPSPTRHFFRTLHPESLPQTAQTNARTQTKKHQHADADATGRNEVMHSCASAHSPDAAPNSSAPDPVGTWLPPQA